MGFLGQNAWYTSHFKAVILVFCFADIRSKSVVNQRFAIPACSFENQYCSFCNVINFKGVFVLKSQIISAFALQKICPLDMAGARGQIPSVYLSEDAAVALTHAAACVGFASWALAAVGVSALFSPFLFRTVTGHYYINFTIFFCWQSICMIKKFGLGLFCKWFLFFFYFMLRETLPQYF